MITATLNWLDRALRPRHVIATLAVVLALGALMSSVILPRLEAMSGDPTIFDLRFSGYSPWRARAYLTALGASGREFYSAALVPTDMLFAFALYVAMSLVIVWFTRPNGGAAKGSSRRRRLVLLALPALATGFSAAENLLILQMLQIGPLVSDAVASTASLFTVGKWLLYVASFAAAAAVAAAALAKRRSSDV